MSIPTPHRTCSWWSIIIWKYFSYNTHH